MYGSKKAKQTLIAAHQTLKQVIEQQYKARQERVITDILLDVQEAEMNTQVQLAQEEKRRDAQQKRSNSFSVSMSDDWDLFDWIAHDVYQRPDHSMGAFYGIVQDEGLTILDPSCQGISSLLTRALCVLGNDAAEIKTKLEQDPVRILRLANASAKFSLEIAPVTFQGAMEVIQAHSGFSDAEESQMLAKHHKFLRLSTRDHYITLLTKLQAAQWLSSHQWRKCFNGNDAILHSGQNTLFKPKNVHFQFGANAHEHDVDNHPNFSINEA